MSLNGACIHHTTTRRRRSSPSLATCRALVGCLQVLATVLSSLLLTMILAEVRLVGVSKQPSTPQAEPGSSTPPGATTVAASATSPTTGRLTLLTPVSKQPVAKRPLYLALGMTGRISCPIDVNPPHTLIVWMRNERALDLTRSTRLRVTRQGALVMRSVVEADAGRYSCVSYSPLEAGQSSDIVVVIVKGWLRLVFNYSYVVITCVMH